LTRLAAPVLLVLAAAMFCMVSASAIILAIPAQAFTTLAPTLAPRRTAAPAPPQVVDASSHGCSPCNCSASLLATHRQDRKPDQRWRDAGTSLDTTIVTNVVGAAFAAIPGFTDIPILGHGGGPSNPDVVNAFVDAIAAQNKQLQDSEKTPALEIAEAMEMAMAESTAVAVSQMEEIRRDSLDAINDILTQAEQNHRQFLDWASAKVEDWQCVQYSSDMLAKYSAYKRFLSSLDAVGPLCLDDSEGCKCNFAHTASVRARMYKDFFGASGIGASVVEVQHLLTCAIPESLKSHGVQFDPDLDPVDYDIGLLFAYREFRTSIQLALELQDLALAVTGMDATRRLEMAKGGVEWPFIGRKGFQSYRSTNVTSLAVQVNPPSRGTLNASGTCNDTDMKLMKKPYDDRKPWDTAPRYLFWNVHRLCAEDPSCHEFMVCGQWYHASNLEPNQWVLEYKLNTGTGCYSSHHSGSWRGGKCEGYVLLTGSWYFAR